MEAAAPGIDVRTTAILGTQAKQRNEAHDMIAWLNGEVAVLQARIAELEAQIAAAATAANDGKATEKTA